MDGGSRRNGYSIQSFLVSKEGECVTLDKFICYSTSLDMEKEKLEAFVQDELAAAKSEGYEKLKEQQKSYMQDFWKTADVEIKGNEELQQGLHFNLFHIIQSAGRDGKTEWGQKDFPERDTKVIISGIQRCMYSLF